MSKELKETMLKEVKGGTMTMSHQVENFNKEIEMIKKKTNGNSGMENYITSTMKSSLEGFNSKFELAEGRIGELEGRWIDMYAN